MMIIFDISFWHGCAPFFEVQGVSWQNGNSKIINVVPSKISDYAGALFDTIHVVFCTFHSISFFHSAMRHPVSPFDL